MTAPLSAGPPAPMLDKTFDPAAIEAKWFAHWEENGLFRPERPDAEPFTIVNPPPNVTGSLHIGHALDNTLQDVVIRYERLRGKDALWVVGTDHAGIATQMVVERQLEARQDKRTNYTREEFVARVWEWKAESGGAITRQLRRLGCSMDWSREQFTMDPHFSRAVTKVFVELYRQGLIYRDKRLVNWDPKLKTAISDLEVEQREVQGHFWHLRYRLADGVRLDSGADHIVVATTRPETMLADMAVAVHPDDPRYRSVIGEAVVLPITGRRIPIIADEHADPELGSGAVKITPGHDFNDFEVGRRAGIRAGDMLNMFDAEANVVQVADRLIPAELLKRDRFEARKLVVEMMDDLGLLEACEERTIPTPFGDRSGVPIEPRLMDQWYVDAMALARPAKRIVERGDIEIVPKSWEKTFFNWMENIQPWCVSRQLWWGHRIPAWHGPELIDGAVQYGSIQDITPYSIFVAENEADVRPLLDKFYDGRPYRLFDDAAEADSWLKAQWRAGDSGAIAIWRDPDVLDTWFSSALWPFATLGWPENTELLQRHYPNSLLISGSDILFFWDARMMMQGLHFMKDVPWRRLYLHGLVRAADGQKMSKSRGNVVDPLILIDKYGADALRFFMAAMESQGRDVKMDEKRLEGYRNFATKLWNAARFCQSNGISGGIGDHTGPGLSPELAVNKWIVGEVVETLAQLDKAMADLRFDAAANAIYHFVWDTFCDWYIELIKGAFDDETRAVAGWVLDQILVMLHPFMPFVTEELWGALGERPYELIVARWPEPAATVDAAAKAQVEWLIEMIGAIRAARNELNVPATARIPLIMWADVPEEVRWRACDAELQLKRLARVSEVRVIEDETASASAQIVVRGSTFLLPLDDVIDVGVEKERLTKARQASLKERDALAKRLANPAFIEKAAPQAVDKARADHAAHAAEAERLAAALARLG